MIQCFHNMKDKIILINPHELIAHERVSLLHAAAIFFEMLVLRQFRKPIIVDSKTKTILDGHHRCYVANRLGLKKVPCYLVDYIEDGSIQVYTRRPEIFINKKEVVNMALSPKVFPEKTTRHEYQIPEFQPLMIRELWQ